MHGAVYDPIFKSSNARDNRSCVSPPLYGANKTPVEAPTVNPAISAATNRLENQILSSALLSILIRRGEVTFRANRDMNSKSGTVFRVRS